MAATAVPRVKTKKLLVRRVVSKSTRRLRTLVQIAFLLLNIAVAFQFYLFVRQFEIPDAAYTVSRPPGVEGWLPIAPSATQWARQWREVKDIARAAGRDPDMLTGAMYLTIAVDDDASRANSRLNAYLEGYYAQPAAVLRSRQANYAGPRAGLGEWLQAYADGGASHLVLRFAGDHERHLETLADLRAQLT